MNPQEVPDRVSVETWMRWRIWMTAKASREVWLSWRAGQTNLSPDQQKLFNWPVFEDY